MHYKFHDFASKRAEIFAAKSAVNDSVRNQPNVTIFGINYLNYKTLPSRFSLTIH